jgi:hypothetical protein
MKTCVRCKSKPSCTCLCREILAEMPSTSNAFSELLMPTSNLPRDTPRKPRISVAEMELSGSTSQRPIRLKGFTARETRILHGRYIERLSHREIAERFDLTEGASRGSQGCIAACAWGSKLVGLQRI